MPLFLPSDPDKFPTEELKKVTKTLPTKPDPRETWTETSPGIFQNGLGQKKTGDMKPKWDESTQPAVYAKPTRCRAFFRNGTALDFPIGSMPVEKADAGMHEAIKQPRWGNITHWIFL